MRSQGEVVGHRLAHKAEVVHSRHCWVAAPRCRCMEVVVAAGTRRTRWVGTRMAYWVPPGNTLACCCCKGALVVAAHSHQQRQAETAETDQG